MSDEQSFGGDPVEDAPVDLVDLHEVEILDGAPAQRAHGDHDDVDDQDDSVAEVIDLDDEHVLEQDVDVESDGELFVESAPDEPVDDVLVLDSWQIELAATGDDQVDSVLSRLTEVANSPAGEHVAVYEAVHSGLQAALASLDRS